MALTKCKECGKEISKEAKACPDCGAPQGPKQYSVGKLFVYGIMAFFLYSIFTADYSGYSTSPTTAATSKKSNGERASTTRSSSPQTREKPRWRTSTSADEMTGKRQAFASSPTALPTKEMDFPYGDVNAWLGVGCDGESEWAYIGFNSAPNLSGTETRDGYNRLSTRIRWDDTIQTVNLNQEWGASVLHFANDQDAIASIVRSSTALLELKWHGQQTTYFRFSLNGSSAALESIRAQCHG